MEGQLKAYFLDHHIFKSAVFYTISLTNDKTNLSHFLLSRYSILLLLHTNLSRNNEKLALVQFPPKRFFGNLRSSFIAKRKLCLEIWFNNLLKITDLLENPILTKFLEEAEILFKVKVFPSQLRVSNLEIEILSNGSKAGTSSPLQKSVLDTLSEFKQNLQNSFNSNTIDPIKALAELEKLKYGKIHLHEFLADHDLTQGNRIYDWEILTVMSPKYKIEEKINSCIFQALDLKKNEKFTIKMFEFQNESNHLVFHYITEVFLLKYIASKIKDAPIFYIKDFIYFEKTDRFHREIKKSMLEKFDATEISLKNSIKIRKHRENYFTEREILLCMQSFIKLFMELEKLGISHNFINPNNIFYSKNEETFKIGNFRSSWHEKQGQYEASELEHLKTNQKYNSPEVNEIFSLKSKNDDQKVNLFKNDVYALGLTFYEMWKLKIFECHDEFLLFFHNDCHSNSSTDTQVVKFLQKIFVPENERPNFETLYSMIAKIYIPKSHNEKNTFAAFNKDMANYLEDLHPEYKTYKNQVKMLTIIAHGYNKLRKHNKALLAYGRILELTYEADLTKTEKLKREIKFLRKQSLVYYDMGEHEKVDQYLLNVLSKCEGIKDGKIYSSILIALAHNKLASYEFKQAKDYLQRTLDIYIAKYGDKSFKLADLYNDLGALEEKTDNFNEAISFIKKSIDLYEINKESPNMLLGQNYYIIGSSNLGLKKYDLSLDNLRTSMQIFQELPIKSISHLSLIKSKKGEVYLQKKEFQKALIFFEEAWMLTKEYAGEGSLAISDIYLNLGKYYCEVNDFEKSKQYLKNCLKIRRSFFEKDHFEVADVKDSLGCLYLKSENYEKASSQFHVALKIFKNQLGKSHLRIADLYNNYGFVQVKLQNLKKARKCHERCLALYKLNLGDTHKNVSITLNNLGSICLESGEYEEALLFFQEALEIINSDNEEEVATLYNFIGVTYCFLNQYDEALKAFQDSYDLLSQKLDRSNPKLVKLVKDIEKLKKKNQTQI